MELMARRGLAVAVLLTVVTACSTSPATVTTSPQAGQASALADPELGARFPANVGGEPFPVETYRNETALRAMGVGSAFLDALNAEISDVSVALGHRPMETETSTHLSAYAYRVVGASESDLAEYFVPIIEEQTEDAKFVRGTVGTREVWRPVGPSASVAGNLLYVNGDTAYLLYGNEPLEVGLLLEALP